MKLLTLPLQTVNQKNGNVRKVQQVLGSGAALPPLCLFLQLSAFEAMGEFQTAWRPSETASSGAKNFVLGFIIYDIILLYNVIHYIVIKAD